jgi:ankyrin repeat protein
VSLLIHHGAHVNAKDTSQQTALIYAAEEGHEQVVSLLIDHGAHVDAKDATNWIALIYAIEQGHAQVVSVLIDRGAHIIYNEMYLLKAVDKH